MAFSTRSRISTTEEAPLPLVLLGAGGHAREILDLLEEVRGQEAAVRTVSLFAEAGMTSEGGLALVRDRGYRLTDSLGSVGLQEFAAAVGDPGLRRRLVGLAESSGLRARTVISPLARVPKFTADGAEGLVVFADTFISTNVTVGRHCHVNQACRVSHDVVLGDFVTLSPGCLVTGNVRIGSSVMLGAGATLVPGVSVGDGAVVGAGAVVIRDVAAGATVVGNPAKAIS